MITPSSIVRFLNVPFSPSQNNVMNFNSINSQVSYMLSKLVYTLSNCTYIREGDGEILKVDKSADQMYNCNYVMFQNSQFGDRWFYAFIEKIIYRNSKVCDLVLKMDVMQTFMFDYDITNAFIERQTPHDDYFNTLADTPSTGDLTTVYNYEKALTGKYFILFNSDPTVNDTSTSNYLYTTMDNYTMPCYMIVCTTGDEMAQIIMEVSNKGRADRIQACYYALVPDNDLGGLYNYVMMGKGDLNLTSDMTLVHNVDTNWTADDFTVNIPYTPKFKKEISYPYAKLEIVDRITGKYIELDVSKFSDPLNPQFRIMWNITENVEYKIIPINYNGIYYSIENALVITPMVDLPIFSNSYAKYLKNNENANLLNNFMSMGSALGSAIVGNPMGAIGSFANIASTINADSVARTQPNQVSGLKGSAYDYLNFTPSIFFRFKVMDTDHLRIARNFWNCYGYPERRISNYVNTSNQYNFIKTVNANIIADKIPSEYQREIENILDKGVTFWNSGYLQYTIL